MNANLPNMRQALLSRHVKQTCLDEQVSQNQLVLHSDNGKPMKGSTILSTLQTLGIVA